MLKAQSWASAYLPAENGGGRGTKTGYNIKLNDQLMNNIYDILRYFFVIYTL